MIGEDLGRLSAELDKTNFVVMGLVKNYESIKNKLEHKALLEIHRLKDTVKKQFNVS